MLVSASRVCGEEMKKKEEPQKILKKNYLIIVGFTKRPDK